MKYSEFEREVERLGCEVYDRGSNLFVKRNTHTILTVNKNREFEFDNEWNKWSGIGEIKSPLFGLAYELAKTPLAEREEEKLYRLQLITKLPFKQCMRFLNIEVETGVCSLNTDRFTYSMKTIFTESEIAEMDITGFEKIEVTPE